MRHIMVLNAKGGCGKSTLATNIAAYFANEGANVALADYDPQRSSLDWLERRPADRPEITGIAAFEDGLRHVPRTADIVVSDAPARSHGKELTDLIDSGNKPLIQQRQWFYSFIQSPFGSDVIPPMHTRRVAISMTNMTW